MGDNLVRRIASLRNVPEAFAAASPGILPGSYRSGDAMATVSVGVPSGIDGMNDKIIGLYAAGRPRKGDIREPIVQNILNVLYIFERKTYLKPVGNRG